jgi:hypothetical protein
VDPVPLLLRKSGSAENPTWTSGSVARNSATRPQRRFGMDGIIVKCILK